MTTAHLTEAELQLYVTEPNVLVAEQRFHVQGCARCQSKAENYVLLFNSIQDAAKPAFDFNLSALVMEQLPAPKRSLPWAALSISILSIAIVAVSLALFWSSAIAVIKSVSIILFAAVATGALVVLFFQALEMLNAHHKQMNVLLRSKTLQL
jgi:hypothetical protein